MADSLVEDLVRKTMGVKDVSYLGVSSGGCINQNATFETEEGKVFIKLNTEEVPKSIKCLFKLFLQGVPFYFLAIRFTKLLHN